MVFFADTLGERLAITEALIGLEPIQRSVTVKTAIQYYSSPGVQARVLRYLS